MPKDSRTYFFISFPLQRRTLSITLSGKFCVIKSKQWAWESKPTPLFAWAGSRLGSHLTFWIIRCSVCRSRHSNSVHFNRLLCGASWSTMWAWAITEAREIQRSLRCVPETQGAERTRGTTSPSRLLGSWNSSRAPGAGAVPWGWADPHCEERCICCGGGESVGVVVNTNWMIFQICLQGKSMAQRSAVTYLTTNDYKSTLALRQEQREGRSWRASCLSSLEGNTHSSWKTSHLRENFFFFF